MKIVSYLGFLFCFFIACKTDTKTSIQPLKHAPEGVLYAEGFSITKEEGYTLLEVFSPWTGSEQKYTYLVIPKGKMYPPDLQVDGVVETPIERMIVTSTTHIPALEMLGAGDRLVAFPGLDYISSETTRKRIAEGKIKEIGNNESINTELVIDLQPDILVGFAVDGHNKAYDVLQRVGIPVIYNGDWTETTPLGKAEWIKFFGVLLEKESEADRIFEEIETEYETARQKVTGVTAKPTVFSGAMWQDIWYMPQGGSWGTAFIQDAGGDYLWAESPGTGSISLSLETVLDRAQTADFWIGPAQFTSYEQMLGENKAYGEFSAFKNRQVYSFASLKGETGGLIYFELAPLRPDWVLKDLIKILHPEALPEHELYFFKPLE